MLFSVQELQLRLAGIAAPYDFSSAAADLSSLSQHSLHYFAMLLPLSHCLQTTASLCLPAQQLVSLQLSVHPLVACCLPWRKPAASGAGKHSVGVTSKQQLGLFMCRLVRAGQLSSLPYHMHTANAHSQVTTVCVCLQAHKLALLPGCCVCDLHAVPAEPQRTARHDRLHWRPHVRKQGLAYTASLHPHQRRSAQHSRPLLLTALWCLHTCCMGCSHCRTDTCSVRHDV